MPQHLPKTPPAENEIRSALAWMRKHRATYGLRLSDIDQAAAYYESLAVLRKLSPRELDAAELANERAVEAALARRAARQASSAEALPC